MIVINKIPSKIIEPTPLDNIAIKVGIQGFLYQFVQVVTVLLKVLLQELEESKFFGTKDEITKDIGIFKHLSTLNNLIDSFIKELKFIHRVLLDIMKQLYFGFNYWS